MVMHLLDTSHTYAILELSNFTLEIPLDDIYAKTHL